MLGGTNWFQKNASCFNSTNIYDASYSTIKLINRFLKCKIICCRKIATFLGLSISIEKVRTKRRKYFNQCHSTSIAEIASFPFQYPVYVLRVYIDIGPAVASNSSWFRRPLKIMNADLFPLHLFFSIFQIGLSIYKICFYTFLISLTLKEIQRWIKYHVKKKNFNLNLFTSQNLTFLKQ